MIIALRATSSLQSFHCRIAWVLANANDVPPKTQIGHDTDNSNLTIFSLQVELDADRHHKQKKKTNSSLKQNAMHCDTSRRLKYLTCTDIQQPLWPTIVVDKFYLYSG